ncbi:hypothetical protein K525DRAFT_280281 [Schizophyllum commune Loenen D]|nr:hypothetical protein K525DRAFT_280281 [Schizophyllum commune Loenen D]
MVSLCADQRQYLDALIAEHGEGEAAGVYRRGGCEATVRLSLTRDWSLSAIYPSVPIADKDGGQTLEWKVQTRADGTLHELNTALDVSYLFWEALTNKVVDSPPSSPVIGQAREVFRPGVTGVSNEDSVLLPVANVTQYLDQVLAALGLHVEARTSFITYWLPDMLKHTHVALRFLDQVAYAHAAPLDVSPNPDVVTRVFMLFCGVKKAELGEWEGAQAKAADSIDMLEFTPGIVPIPEGRRIIPNIVYIEGKSPTH